MRKIPMVLSAIGLAAVALCGGRLDASHAPVPAPPDLVFVGVEPYTAPNALLPGIISGYWHVFDVTSKGGSDWITGHSGNAYKLWQRRDSHGDTAFQNVTVKSDVAAPSTYVGSKQATFRIRTLLSPAEFEWTNSFHVTEVGGQPFASGETAPSQTVTVTTPMPPVVLDTRFGAEAAAGFRNDAGSPSSVSSLPSLVAATTQPTIRMLIFGFNLAYPDFAWSETGPVPETYPKPRIRWNGEFGLVSGERKYENGNAVEFDVPVDILVDHEGTGTAQIEVVQGTAEVASAAYTLTLVPPPPGPRNVVAVGDVKKPAKKSATVNVRWDAPASGPAPSGYVIERRVAADPAKRKDVGVFIELASVAGDILEFQDKKAVPDEFYEYRIGARLDQLTYAQPDDAWTANKGLKFYGSNGDLWPFVFEDEKVNAEPATVDEFPVDTEVRVYRMRAPGITILFAMSRKTAQRSEVVMKGQVTDRSDDPGLPGWATALKDGDKPSLELSLQRGDPFDPGAYVNVTGTLRVGKARYPVTMKRRAQASLTTIDVAATVGEGSKGKALKPGEVVAVTFECFNLHQEGLVEENDFTNIRGAILAGTTLLSVTVENGKFDQVLPFPFSSEHFAVVGDPVGKDRVVFKVGALGRDSKGRLDTARLALAVKVNATVTPPLKLRTEFIFDKDDAGRQDGFNGTQRARILARGERRIADVQIEKPAPAKDED